MTGEKVKDPTVSKRETVQTAPAEMPGVEEIQFVLAQPLKDDDWVVENARAILALFAPILAEKERDNRQLKLEVAAERETSRISIYGWRDKENEMEARALAAEAALAAARARAAQIGYRVCAETPHVTLGDKVAAAIRAQGDGNA